MEFKTRRIRNTERIIKKKQRNFSNVHFTISASLIVSLIVITFLAIGIGKALKSIDFTLFLAIAGDDLETDQYGHTNFLLLGTGGENHEGGDLTDTIIVASLDNENKLVTMLSIPRDLYVEDSKIGSSRINEVYYNGLLYFEDPEKALDYMRKKVEEIIDAPIHYWAKVDFEGFKDLIDAIGGIDITVPVAINDPYYPKDGTFLFEPFKIAAGPQHLDGSTALKYARSRKTTSDFDRADRQQQIIFAMKEQALATNVLLSKEKLENILRTLRDNIETNISTQEILTLGSFAKNFTKERITHKLIHDDPTQCGGFLYTPDRRLYGGAFILIPAGGPEMLHQYIDLAFNSPEVVNENTRIQILNGTKRGGTAGETKQILQRFCLNVVRYGNANDQSVQKTTYYYKDALDENGNIIKKRPAILDFLQIIIPGEESTVVPENYKQYMAGTDIILEIGYDYTDSDNYISDPFFYLPTIEPYDEAGAEGTGAEGTGDDAEATSSESETTGAATTSATASDTNQ